MTRLTQRFAVQYFQRSCVGGEVIIKGGTELQRCLYAFAVKTLLGTGDRGVFALSERWRGRTGCFRLLTLLAR
jgi:hypothetical protein